MFVTLFSKQLDKISLDYEDSSSLFFFSYCQFFFFCSNVSCAHLVSENIEMWKVYKWCYVWKRSQKYWSQKKNLICIIFIIAIKSAKWKSTKNEQKSKDYIYHVHIADFNLKLYVFSLELFPFNAESRIPFHAKLFKDWSQFMFGSWRNNLNQVVHTV